MKPDPYVEALVRCGLDRVEAERRVSDQRRLGLLSDALPVQTSLFDPHKGDCPMCNGTGRLEIPRYVVDSLTGKSIRLDVCPNCGGSGSPTIPF